MCYKRPGPRCSAWAIKQRDEARLRFQNDRSVANYEAMRQAEENYYMTPAGFDALEDKIAKTGDPDGVIAAKLEYYRARRKELIALAKDVERGDVPHDVTDGELPAVPLDPAEEAVAYNNMSQSAREHLALNLATHPEVYPINGHPEHPMYYYYTDRDVEGCAEFVDMATEVMRSDGILQDGEPRLSAAQFVEYEKQDREVFRPNGGEAEGTVFTMEDLVDRIYYMRHYDSSFDHAPHQ